MTQNKTDINQALEWTIEQQGAAMEEGDYILGEVLTTIYTALTRDAVDVDRLKENIILQIGEEPPEWFECIDYMVCTGHLRAPIDLEAMKTCAGHVFYDKAETNPNYVYAEAWNDALDHIKAKMEGE